MALAIASAILPLAGCSVAPTPNNNGAANDNASANDNAAAEPIFAANYRTTYTLVRDCRNSIEHGATIRVYANDVGATAYLAEAETMPVGSILVKEEFTGIDCDNDMELVYWAVMKKEAPGYDPEDNDWRFQESGAPDRRITIDGKASCIECHRATECVERDYMCTEGP
jgi:hypothetical protein